MMAAGANPPQECQTGWDAVGNERVDMPETS